MAQLKTHVKRLLGWHESPHRPAAQEPPRTELVLDGPGAELLARARAYYWFHSIDLGNGVVTAGSKSLDLLRAEADAIFGPLQLRGKSVLDIGAWNGNFSFEAKRRQAARVLATDHHCWTPEVKGRDTFHLAKSALGLEIEELDVDVPELSLDRVGQFDVVLFLGVFYHLVDPVRALQNLVTLTKEVAVIESHLDLDKLDRPAMVFYPGAELNNDPTNYWGPNRQCMEALLKLVGFKRIVYRPHPIVGAHEGSSMPTRSPDSQRGSRLPPAVA